MNSPSTKTNLKSVVVKGFSWIIVVSLGGQLITQLTTFILAKFLLPADFGIIAVVVLVLNVVQIFREGGISKAVIYHSGDKDSVLSTALIITIFSGIVTYVFLYLAAPLIAVFFNESSLVQILRVMGVSFFISSWAIVPSALLEKDLAYREKVWPDLGSVVTYALVAVVMAVKGFGVWSIVFARIAQSIIFTVLVWKVCRWQIRFSLNKELLYGLLRYSRDMIGISTFVMIFLNIDNALIGRVSGTEALGFYAFAFSLANLPTQFVTPAVNRISFPTYVKLRENIEGLAKVYLLSLRMISYVTFPTTLGLAVICAPLLKTLYGSKWLLSVELVYVLTIYALFRSIAALPTNVFLSIGKQIIALRIQIAITLAAMVFAFVGVIFWGSMGVAVAMTATLTVGTAMWLVLLKNFLPITTTDLLSAMAPQAVVASIMVLVIVLLSTILPESGWAVVGLLVIAGSIIYSLGLLIITKGGIYHEIRNLLVVYAWNK